MLFQFINSNIENQYEFVLRQWVNDSEFAGAVELHPKSKDPLIGTQDPAESIFVIPQADGAPPIEVTGLSSFVTTKAAAYTFLPSITAIRSAIAPRPPHGIERRAVMADTSPTDVLVAGYRDIDDATKDFEALVALVKAKRVSIDGVILVTHAQDGSVSVRQTGDNLGRKGAGWGGGVGVAVGLFAPPLLASVAVGAVAGGVVGRFVDHRVEKEIHDKIGENLPPGSAGIIAVFDDEQRLAVGQALAGARAPLGGRRATRQGIRALKESLAEAMGKFSPRPDGAADPGSELRGHGRAHRSTRRSPIGRST